VQHGIVALNVFIVDIKNVPIVSNKKGESMAAKYKCQCGHEQQNAGKCPKCNLTLVLSGSYKWKCQSCGTAKETGDNYPPSCSKCGNSMMSNEW